MGGEVRGGGEVLDLIVGVSGLKKSVPDRRSWVVYRLLVAAFLLLIKYWSLLFIIGLAFLIFCFYDSKGEFSFFFFIDCAV